MVAQRLSQIDQGIDMHIRLAHWLPIALWVVELCWGSGDAIIHGISLATYPHYLPRLVRQCIMGCMVLGIAKSLAPTNDGFRGKSPSVLWYQQA